MLEKQRNTLIKKAFESAKIIAPGTELTALEIDDAAYTLNCMLQGWSNEGFRLFNMKTGYMPLLSKKNEYKLSTEAYSQFGSSRVLSVESIGATKVKVNSIKDMAKGQSLVFLNNTLSKQNKILDIDYTNTTLLLDEPVSMSIYAKDDVFFGSVSSATTEIKQYVSGFSSIALSNYSVLPLVGDTLYINFANSWQAVTVSNVDTSAGVVYFLPEMNNGNVTKSQVIYGSMVGRATVAESIEVSPRKLNLDSIPFVPNTISIMTGSGLDEGMLVESVSDNHIVLEKPVSSVALSLLGKQFVDGKETYTSADVLKWNQIPSSIINRNIDWGSVNDVPADELIDWGFVSDIVSGKEDYKTLTGSAQIIGFVKSADDYYVSIKSDDLGLLLYRDFSGAWSVIEDGIEAKLFSFNGAPYAYNVAGGVWSLSGTEKTQVFSGMTVEHSVCFAGEYYLVSPATGGKKTIVSTKDFIVFSNAYQVPESVDFLNAVEFKGKMYCGKGKTFVSSDMKSFYDLPVYSDYRVVVGDVLQNFNFNTVCSYTKNGVDFVSIPAVTASVSSAFSIYGCTFISVYGKVLPDGSVGSQIFSINNFGEVWTPQTTLSGRTFEMRQDYDMLVISSDTEIKMLKLFVDTKTDDTEAYLFGSPIGRPQELMNVVKYGLNTSTQLSMEEMALKDYSQLPHIKADGEPVSYCFFREASDGKLMVWGTPRKFGEYLKFTYVEPIALLDNARSIPDIPDEYVGAVIDGLAAELAYEYALPTDKVQLLEAKAEASKQLALLHDNEMASYTIEPNRRGL